MSVYICIKRKKRDCKIINIYKNKIKEEEESKSWTVFQLIQVEKKKEKKKVNAYHFNVKSFWDDSKLISSPSSFNSDLYVEEKK